MAARGGGVMVICRFEPVAYLLKTGLIELGREHWEAVSFDEEHPEYRPDWGMYQEMENGNSLRFIAMRENDKLIGYMSIVIDHEIHNNKLFMANIRDIYIAKEKRGHAAKLLRYLSFQMESIGVNYLTISARSAGKVDPSNFYSLMGFKPVETVYFKKIGH